MSSNWGCIGVRTRLNTLSRPIDFAGGVVSRDSGGDSLAGDKTSLALCFYCHLPEFTSKVSSQVTAAITRSMSNISRDEAQEIINEIRASYGVFDPDDSSNVAGGAARNGFKRLLARYDKVVST